MVNEDKASFREILLTALFGYGQQMPTAEMMRAWWKFLEAFPIDAVRDAFAKHCSVSEFAPRPVDIAKLCRNNDRRPSADEAWATAIAAQDEDVTVVWSDEIAEAFFIAKPLLDERDKVGARMAFINAYNRIVAENREKGIPYRTTVSLGHNAEQRHVAIETAQANGLLTSNVPNVHIAYNFEKAESEHMKKVHACINELKKMLAMPSEDDETLGQRQLRITNELKAKMQAKVDAYKKGLQ